MSVDSFKTSSTAVRSLSHLAKWCLNFEFSATNVHPIKYLVRYVQQQPLLAPSKTSFSEHFINYVASSGGFENLLFSFLCWRLTQSALLPCSDGFSL